MDEDGTDRALRGAMRVSTVFMWMLVVLLGLGILAVLGTFITLTVVLN